MADDEQTIVHFELKNTQPVDLLDLTTSLAAMGEAYQDFAVAAGYDDVRGNTRLFVRKIEAGSIIADLAAYAEQASFVLKRLDVAVGFLTHLKELTEFFLGFPIPTSREPPSRKEAEQIIQLLEPAAKDNGSQLILNVSRSTVHVHINSQQSNAIQNAAKRFLGPPLPSSEIRHDQLLVLHQVRDELKATSGDKGIVEEISSNPVKLIFATEEAKKIVLNAPHPFQKIFIVDIEVKRSAGRVALYRVLVVKDSMEKGEAEPSISLS